MLVKVVVSVFMCFVIFFGVRNLDMLLTAPRTKAQVESVRKGSKGRLYATVTFKSADGRDHRAELSTVEGNPKPGSIMTVMYREQDPQGTATYYSPSLYVLPFFLFPGALGTLAYLWIFSRKKPKATQAT